MVRQAAGKLEYSFGGCIIGDEFRSAFPADFDTREQIGLGSGKTVETSRFELQLTKNLDVRGKGYQGAAPVGRSADLFQRAQRSEERRVGKECVSTCRSRWSQYH